MHALLLDPTRRRYVKRFLRVDARWYWAKPGAMGAEGLGWALLAITATVDHRGRDSLAPWSRSRRYSTGP
jgi:hypothetical protein